MTEKTLSGWARTARGLAVAALVVTLAPAASTSFAATASSAPGTTPRKRHVLILNSYEPTYRWTANVVRGVQSVFENMDDVELHVEYMDSKKTFTPEYAKLLSDLYVLRYRSLRFDLILSSDDDALNFLETYRDQLFPGVPVVFCGVNNLQAQRIAGLTNVTGVNEESDLDRNLAWVAQLRPSTVQIVFIFDGSATSLSYLPRVRALEPRWKHRFKFRFISDVTIAELERELRGLPQDAVVFWGMFMLDKAKTPLSMGESHRIAIAASPVPVFGFSDVSLSHGAAGGYVVSGFTQGETAARMGARILAGARAADIPIVRQSPNVYMVDFPSFKRWQLDLQHLPDGTVVMNKPFSFYERYRRYVWAALGGMVTESMVILALIAAIRRVTRKNRARLRLSEERYRSIVEDGSELICRFSSEGRVVFANGAVARLLGRSAADVVGSSVWSLWGARPDETTVRQVGSLARAQPIVASEQAVVTGTGEKRWVLWTYRGLFSSQDELTEIQAVGHDITARRDAELALQGALRKVEEGNAELGHANQNLQGVLDSMREALVVCDRHGRLTNVHSKAAAEWLGMPAEGLSISDYLFPVETPEKLWFQMAIDQMVEELLPFGVAVGQLPRTLERGNRTCSLACHRVLRDGQCVGLVFTLADVTQQLEQNQIQELHRELPTIVGNLLRDRDGFQAFVEETEQMLARLRVVTDATEMRRLLHTLKGNTAIYGFELFAARCHALEDLIEIDPGDSVAESGALAEFEALAGAWSSTLASFSVFLDDQPRASIRLEQSEYADLLQRLESREDHAQLLRLAQRWSQPPISQVLGIYGRTIRQLAIRLGKEVEPHLADHGLRLPSGEMRSFLGVLVHVVRNAIDHGIESRDERQRLGKPRAGRVSIESRVEGPELVVAVEDDGGGVDWDAVRHRAQMRALPATTDRDLVDALFADGLTTRDAASDVSGRGIGLGAVRQICEQLGGAIHVDSRRGQGTRFEFRFVLSSLTRDSGRTRLASWV